MDRRSGGARAGCPRRAGTRRRRTPCGGSPPSPPPRWSSSPSPAPRGRCRRSRHGAGAVHGLRPGGPGQGVLLAAIAALGARQPLVQRSCRRHDAHAVAADCLGGAVADGCGDRRRRHPRRAAAAVRGRADRGRHHQRVGRRFRDHRHARRSRPTSDQPGPNRFTVRVVDYDSKAPVRDARVSLRFTPVDDPGIAPSSLRLEPAAGDTLRRDRGRICRSRGAGRLRCSSSEPGTSTEVQLDVEVRGAPLTVTTDRRPGRPARYSVAIKGEGSIWISPDPERAGPSTLHISSIDLLSDYRPIEDVVVTWAADGRPARQLPIRRIDRSNFTADVELAARRQHHRRDRAGPERRAPARRRRYRRPLALTGPARRPADPLRLSLLLSSN